jgi:hypothetical protein
MTSVLNPLRYNSQRICSRVLFLAATIAIQRRCLEFEQVATQYQRRAAKQGEWQDKAAQSWIQYQHADGRKRLVTSYAVVCNDQHRLPRTLELLGSNDGGANWTRLNLQA